MKVCTDSLLFGAMAQIKTGDCVLDIGSGNGLLSLMLAQLGAAQITAVEIDRETSLEASGNFTDSHWANRLTAVHQAIQSYAHETDKRYSLIISNPPFFDRHFKTADPLKRMARHNDSLSYAELIAAAGKLLATGGLFYVLLPSHAVLAFCGLATEAGFFLNRQISYRGYENNPAKVAALSFSRANTACETGTITIYESQGQYSQASSAYLQAFLLRFADVQRSPLRL